MKTKLWLAASLFAACMYTTTASADIVFGVKAGTIEYDVPASSSGVNASLQLAFDIFDLGIADIALEAEYSTSLSDGRIGIDEVSFESTGLYAALRTAGPIYAIVRAGYVDAKIGSIADDSGSALGVGVGFSGGLRMEIEYTKYEIDNIDIEYLTVGFAF